MGPPSGVCCELEHLFGTASVIEHLFSVKGLFLEGVRESPHQRGGLSPSLRKERIVKVILTANVPKVGKAGELKEVASGYARNYLIANGLAIPAIGGAANRVAAEIASRATKVDRVKQEAEEYAKKISATALTMGVKVGEGGKLFGSITNKEIADALERRGITVEKHQVLLDEPLKQLGTYKVQVKVAAHLIAEVTVTVEPKS